MKKVGILTFHNAINYGAVLQTYALYKVLINLGAQTKVIDYRASFNEKRFAKKKLKYWVNPRNIYNALFRNSYQTFNNKIFDDFIQSHICLTSPIRDKSGLYSLNDEFDCFISGSDQVWNLACTENDESYFLDFVTDVSKRNSYAASIGYTEFPPDKVDKYKSLLQNINNISVREKEAVGLISTLIGRDVQHVLDPTLLLNKEEWNVLIDGISRPEHEEYMLLYLMSEDKELINFAKTHAKKHGLKIIYINQRFFKMKGANNIKDISPQLWLSYIYNAQVVVTNSFHGLIFSLNFKTDVYTKYIPRSIANSRLSTVIDIFDLHYRRIGSESFNPYKQIDFERITKITDALRNKSISFLNRVLHD